MNTKNFNLLPFYDKVALFNSARCKLVESRSCFGTYKTHIYEMDGTRLHVVINRDTNTIILINALDEPQLEIISDAVCELS